MIRSFPLPDDMIKATNETRSACDVVSESSKIMSLEVFCPKHFRWEVPGQCILIRTVMRPYKDKSKKTQL